jgi:hypothetical protein
VAFQNGIAVNNNYHTLFPYLYVILLNDSDSSLSCLGHVVNLGNVDVMDRITKIAVVKNATAIWEYDPS